MGQSNSRNGSCREHLMHWRLSHGGTPLCLSRMCWWSDSSAVQFPPGMRMSPSHWHHPFVRDLALEPSVTHTHTTLSCTAKNVFCGSSPFSHLARTREWPYPNPNFNPNLKPNPNTLTLILILKCCCCWSSMASTSQVPDWCNQHR